MCFHPQTRVLIADDHPVALEGLSAIVARVPGAVVVAEASNGEEAVRLYREVRPDLTIIDLKMPVLGGVEAIRQIREFAPHAKFIVMTTFDGDEDIHRALAAGALSYLLKDTARHDLANAIQAVRAGQRYIPTTIAAKLAEFLPRVELTEREREVLDLVARGLRNKEIGGELGIAEHTVKAHVQNILGKLGVDDRTAAVTVALQRGILRLP
jgi:two-component system NarL family response regulator